MSRLRTYLQNTATDQQSSAAIAYLAAYDHIAIDSPEIAQLIDLELQDQRKYLKLIASENYSSLAVQLAMGNLLTDKYAEGISGKRFYAGCKNVDSIETQASEELKALFNCEHAYVQPHSGADANIIAFWSILTQRIQNPEIEKLGKKSVMELSDEEHEKVRLLMAKQKMMGMSLNAGGHLTHGYRLNLSSKMMQAVSYDINPETGLIDYSALAKQVKEEKPAILLAGYSAYPRLLNFAKFREIADSVGATLMVDMAHFAGLVAGKALIGEEDPVPYADVITSTTHKTLRGPRGGLILCKKEFAESVNKGCPMVMGGPLPHVMAAKAIAFKEASTPEFSDYAHKIISNAKVLAEGLLRRGAKLITGGTDNHLIIIDVGPFGITGRQAEQILRDGHMTVNRNAIPFDQNGPWFTSGVRIGTAALTSLGMGAEEMDMIAGLIVDLLKHSTVKTDASGKVSKVKYTLDSAVRDACCERVSYLKEKYPLYPELPSASPALCS
jgi:glycine hydroxymethyltransferase